MQRNRESEIIQSWQANAELWTSAVRTEALESRKLVTNEAILSAIFSCEGSRVLDVGCGEGWLSQELLRRGKDVTGFDVSEQLIASVKAVSGGKFYVQSYEGFASRPKIYGEDFDCVVCNFSLLGDDISALLKAMQTVTRSNGHLVIQTLHPHSVVGDSKYEDGWREETFQGLAGAWAPMPWYFRTMETWIRDLTSAGWRIKEIQEPLHPKTGKPASVIFVLKN